MQKTQLTYDVPAIAHKATDRRWFKNESNGYVRRGMPERAPGESEALLEAAALKRARKAAKVAAGQQKAAETKARREASWGQL